MMTKRQFTATVCQIAAGLLLAWGTTTAQAADVSGTYTWTTPARQDGGTPRKSTLTLKAEGDKLTGKISSPGRDATAPARETEITEGKVTGNEVAFKVVREFNGNKMTQKYSGKVSADDIKGKVEFERNGETQSRDWEAKREAKK